MPAAVASGAWFKPDCLLGFILFEPVLDASGCLFQPDTNSADVHAPFQGGLVLVGTGAGAAAVPQRGPTSPLAAVRQALALSAVPDTLLCRDHEKGQLTQFLDTAVTEGEWFAHCVHGALHSPLVEHRRTHHLQSRHR